MDRLKVCLYNIEPKIYNTAYMQISKYHKNKGDTVKWYEPLFDQNYDILYCSSLFDFTDKSEVPDNAITGGTGYDIKKKLIIDIDGSDLDYTIYPECETSYLWFSRGCNNNCPFCIVREKEGYIHSVQPKNRNPQEKYITIQDNSFFDDLNWKSHYHKLLNWNVPISFSSGINIRTITYDQMDKLLKLKIHKQIYIAWDNPKQRIDFNIIPKKKRYKFMCYVLIGYNSTPEEDLYRVETLRELKIDPFVMPYNKSKRYQMKFARWVNRKELFAKVVPGRTLINEDKRSQ